MNIVAAPLALGLDAGGTATRWALHSSVTGLCGEGRAGGLSALMLLTPEGRTAAEAVLRDIAAACGVVHSVCAGVTGFDGDAAGPLAVLLGASLGLPSTRVRLFNDIELACRAAFAPGGGYLVYAGTGSVAAYVDEQQQLHRAGGRGGLIDDGGSGYWIAREALRHIWRTEDERPLAWQHSPLAREVFAVVGGSDWAATRSWVYGASRGQLGELALAVAAAADDDPAAAAILAAAGRELARLARALIARCGPRPVQLAGRVFELHPAIERHLRQALGPDIELRSPVDLGAHRAAARIAAADAVRLA